MFTLVTGIPGSSKSLNTLELVENECEGRDIYYFNIPELTLDWTEITGDQFLDWMSFPKGSVFVIDECHKLWPNVAHTKPSPPSVIALDEHRHGGYDFYCITQQPTKIDFRARHMVGRHIHFSRVYGREMAKRYEWQKCQNSPDDYHARQEAEVTVKRFPKKYYDVYKSADMHTVKKRIPKKAVLALGGIVLSIGLIANFVYGLGTRGESDEPSVSQVHSEIPDLAASMSNPMNMPASVEPEEMTYTEKWTPRIPDLPFSAPVYDSLTKVKTFPRPQCVRNEEDQTCRCFTQQATPLDMSYSACMNLVENGWFNPFKEEAGEGPTQGKARAPGVAPAESKVSWRWETRESRPVYNSDPSRHNVIF